MAADGTIKFQLAAVILKHVVISGTISGILNTTIRAIITLAIAVRIHELSRSWGEFVVYDQQHDNTMPVVGHINSRWLSCLS